MKKQAIHFISSVMKLNSVWNLKSSLRISSFKTQLKYASTEMQKPQVQYGKESSRSNTHSRKKHLFSPELPRERLEKLANITSIVVALNHVSWAKISLPDVRVLNWNAYTLPNEFLEDLTETEILETAHILKKNIPSSDLYVMENRPRKCHYPNEICLRSILVSLLSPLQNGRKDHNIVFQKPSVINTVHSLLIGGERISTRKILQQKSYLKFSKQKRVEKLDNGTDSKSFKNMKDVHFHCLSRYSKEKQESLSTALLLALTFLDVAVFQTPESLSKVYKKHYHRILD